MGGLRRCKRKRGGVLSWSRRILMSSSFRESRIEENASSEACWGACASLSWTVSEVAILCLLNSSS